jgi:hypothetical protein
MNEPEWESVRQYPIDLMKVEVDEQGNYFVPREKVKVVYRITELEDES